MTRTDEPTVCGSSFFFYTDKPHHMFGLKTTKKTIHIDDASKAGIAWTTKSLQSVPRQARGLAFMFEDKK
jgi:hypothetical protein